MLIHDGRCRPFARASFPALSADPERDGRNSTVFFIFARRVKNTTRVKSATLVKKAGGTAVSLPPSNVCCDWPIGLFSCLLTKRLTNSVPETWILSNIHTSSIESSSPSLYGPIESLRTLCPTLRCVWFAGLNSAQPHWFRVKFTKWFMNCSLAANERSETAMHNPPSDCSAPAKWAV